MKMPLHTLEQADRDVLVDMWTQAFGSNPPPNSSQDTLRLALGWEVQARDTRSDVKALKTAIRHLLGPDISNGLQTKTKLSSALAIKIPPHLSPGTRLSREWNGRSYVVDVLDKGFAYDGHLYSSLTPIAKIITGSHRSGPQFFGVVK